MGKGRKRESKIKENHPRYREQKYSDDPEMARRESRMSNNGYKTSDEFMEISINALGGNEEKEKSAKKIVKNVLKEVMIDKNV